MNIVYGMSPKSGSESQLIYNLKVSALKFEENRAKTRVRDLVLLSKILSRYINSNF